MSNDAYRSAGDAKSIARMTAQACRCLQVVCQWKNDLFTVEDGYPAGRMQPVRIIAYDYRRK